MKFITDRIEKNKCAAVDRQKRVFYFYSRLFNGHKSDFFRYWVFSSINDGFL